MDEVERIIFELGLWKPQQLALKRLNGTLSIVNLADKLEQIQAALSPLRFDTQFPSFTFDMATGTGKTKLMGASILYLLRRHASRNFFILAPGDTIYRKLIDDFTKGTEKFVFKGVSDLPEFRLITGEDYDRQDPTALGEKNSFNIFIFNIQKIWKSDFRFYSFKETLGASFGDLIKGLKDLVVLMDESHHYRGEQSGRAINELSPTLGLEFTATPSFRGNIIYSYSLGDAVKDGLIKRLRAVIRRNDRSYEDELDEMKLIDGLELHRRKRVYLQTYCKNHGLDLIEPRVFISTKDIAHGKRIQDKLESDKFMKGEFKGKTLFIHSGSEDEQIDALMNLERVKNPTEVVIHVNKLKEGWDVRSIYTIIPIRASISEILVEQTLGRGVRLPFAGVTKEDIGDDPEAFTLDVITYKLKADTYKDVINAAQRNNIITKDYDEDEDKGKALESRLIAPTNPKASIPIPTIAGLVRTTGRLKYFNTVPAIKKFGKIKAETAGLDLVTEEVQQLGPAAQTIIVDQVRSLVSRLIQEIDELDSGDRSTVERMVATYMSKATRSKSPREWNELLKMHRRDVFDDIANQIRDQIASQIKVKHELQVKKGFEFGNFSATVYKDLGVQNKAEIGDEEIRRTIVNGYTKSVYSECVFNSRQEKWFADILDAKGNEVLKWVKNPNQLAIKYRFGRYMPDFVVQTATGFLIVEIKSSAELADPIVMEKAKEAIKWCKVATEETGNDWDYKMIPHDKVTRNDTFKATISRAVAI